MEGSRGGRLIVWLELAAEYRETDTGGSVRVESGKQTATGPPVQEPDSTTVQQGLDLISGRVSYF